MRGAVGCNRENAFAAPSADAALADALEYSAFPRACLCACPAWMIVRRCGICSNAKAHNGIPPSADTLAFSDALEYSAFPPCLPVRLSRVDDRPALRYMRNRESAQRHSPIGGRGVSAALEYSAFPRACLCACPAWMIVRRCGICSIANARSAFHRECAAFGARAMPRRAAIVKARNGIPPSADALAFSAALEYSAFPPCQPERSSRMDDRPAVRWAMKCAAVRLQSRKRVQRSTDNARRSGRGLCCVGLTREAANALHH